MYLLPKTKILLAEAMMRCRKRMTIGVTEANMLRGKTLPELALPCGRRITELHNYLKDCDPFLKYNLVPIKDPFGPSIVEEDLEAIVGSDETEGGCKKVNEKRQVNLLRSAI
jgi:phosphopantetheine adenylyltransferase